MINKNHKRVNTLAELDALYSKPQEASLVKELPMLNEEYRRLIDASPFVSIASIGPDGMDCSPRGDAPGFVRIMDDHTLLIPDRRGNNRLDTLRNIVVDPRVALLFLIPGLNETLRVNGQAHLSVDEQLLQLFEVNGNSPLTAIVVKVERVYFQCARALKRSHLWDPAHHVDPGSLPSAGMLIRAAHEGFDAVGYDAQLEQRQADTLY